MSTAVDRTERRFDPETLRPLYPSAALARERRRELAVELARVERSAPRMTHSEYALRCELVDLHLADAALPEALAVAESIARRARMARSGRHQFLARLVRADLRVWQRDDVRATLDLIELGHAAERQPHAVRALTWLRMGRCEYVQGLWSDARSSFQWALIEAEQARLGPAFDAEAGFALGRAEERLRGAAA